MLVNSCETKLDGGQWVARPGSPDSRWWEREHWPGETSIEGEFRSGISGGNNKDLQTPAKPLSRPSGAAPYPEEYPLVFPTEILITQNPPKLRKVSLKVLDSAGAAEQKRGDYRGEREPDENLFTDFFQNTGYKWTSLRTYKERDFENCDKRQYTSKVLEKNKQ